MRLVLASLLVLAGCASAQPETSAHDETKAEAAFFDCLTKLGPDQSKGIAACEKLL